jgi:hypothetical protein
VRDFIEPGLSIYSGLIICLRYPDKCTYFFIVAERPVQKSVRNFFQWRSIAHGGHKLSSIIEDGQSRLIRVLAKTPQDRGPINLDPHYKLFLNLRLQTISEPLRPSSKVGSQRVLMRQYVKVRGDN